MSIKKKKSEKQTNKQTSEKQSKDQFTISGKEVSCSTLVTETPALSKADAVPPVETIVYLQRDIK